MATFDICTLLYSNYNSYLHSSYISSFFIAAVEGHIHLLSLIKTPANSGNTNYFDCKLQTSTPFGELKDLKESLEFAGKEIISLKAEMAETSTTVKEKAEDMNSFDTDIEVLKRRNIKFEAYTRRENIRIYNIKEESDENTEEQVRNLFVAKLRIPQNDVDAIPFERVHRIPVKPSSQRSQSRGPRPVIVRFSHYQNKEFVRSFYKNLKGTKIGISDDFPREVEEIHKTLYPVLKQAKREQKRAFFNFDKLIINGQIYRGEETKNLPYYGNIMKNFV